MTELSDADDRLHHWPEIAVCSWLEQAQLSRSHTFPWDRSTHILYPFTSTGFSSKRNGCNLKVQLEQHEGCICKAHVSPVTGMI